MNQQNSDHVNPPSLSDVLETVFEQIETRGQRGIETGYLELDEMTNGLQNGELILVAARPSVGKTAFVANILQHVAGNSNVPALMLTMEMTEEQFTQRMICSHSGVDGHKLRKGMLRSHEYAHVANTVGVLSKMPLWVQSLDHIQLNDLCDLARHAVRELGAKLMVVDYVQLIDAQGDNRTEQLTTISRKLKALAMELNVPIMCVSQLNRGMFQPTAPRPRMADIRGSGTFEEDSDVVILLHREDLTRMDEFDYVPDNIAEVIIAKQRNGPTGTVKLTFMNKTTRFENLSAAADPF
jgi:replicative DNA helicase